MSLLVTSSRQQEFDGVANKNIGIERSFSYINHMRSPLIIDANSEIAVVSVKCERNSNLEVDARGFRVGLYWGTELTNGENLDSAFSTNGVVYANVAGGTYTPGELSQALESALNEVATHTYSNMNSVVVETQEDSNGDFTGFEFKFIQNASTTDVKASLSHIATINANNETPIEPLNETYTEPTYDHTDDYTWTPGTQTMTADATGLATATFSHPLSSTSGVCEIDFSGATKDFKIGLVRNFPEDRPCPQDFNFNTGLEGTNFNRYDEFYDFAFSCERTDAETTSSNFCCQSYIDVNQAYGMGQINNASQQAEVADADFGTANGSFGRVRITRFGEELKVELRHNSGAGGDTTIFDSTDAAIKPIGLYDDLLYLKMELTAGGGDLVVLQFDSDQSSNRVSTDERNYGFGTSFDAVEEAEQLNRNIESRPGVCATLGIVEVGNGFTDFVQAPTYTKINASGGQDRNWVMVTAPSLAYNTGDMIVNDSSDELGFIDPIVRESRNTTPASTTNDVIFDSDRTPGLLQLKNMFVRFNGLQQTTYNANKGSISKIIYACPRFDSAGTRTGELYYEPHERVYVDCNNPDQIMLSDVAIDLVDINEQYCTDLVGQTQINFHIRKKK